MLKNHTMMSVCIFGFHFRSFPITWQGASRRVWLWLQNQLGLGKTVPPQSDLPEWRQKTASFPVREQSIVKVFSNHPLENVPTQRSMTLHSHGKRLATLTTQWILTVQSRYSRVICFQGRRNWRVQRTCVGSNPSRTRLIAGYMLWIQCVNT